MSKVLDILRKQKVPVDSPVSAAQHLGHNGIGKLADKEYVKRISEIVGINAEFKDSNMYRMSYSYLVTDLIIASDNTDKPDVSKIWRVAKLKARKLVENESWMFATSDKEPKLDAEGNVKPKKGAKKELAMEVYANDIKGKIDVRKDAIAILVEKVGLTPAGASTYYANLKKKNGVL